MYLFKVIILLAIITTISSCGRNGAKLQHSGYPKAYPSVNILNK